MKRSYKQGTVNDAIFFVGTEVEHTPAYGRKTLFVTGIQDIDEISKQYTDNDCEHIFFGANHSVPQHKVGPGWGEMIEYFLKKDYWCSLDIPITSAEEILEDGLVEYNNFIPQIRVPIPYVKLWNYNTMVKIDDKGFAATNPVSYTHLTLPTTPYV